MFAMRVVANPTMRASLCRYFSSLSVAFSPKYTGSYCVSVGPFHSSHFTSNYRVNTGVINNINYGPVPFRWDLC